MTQQTNTAKTAEPDKSALRDRSLELAIQASKPDALAPAIVAKALVFEHYLEKGTILSSGMYEMYADQVREMTRPRPA